MEKREESRETRVENFKLFGVPSDEISREKNSHAPLWHLQALVGRQRSGAQGSVVAPRFFSTLARGFCDDGFDGLE